MRRPTAPISAMLTVLVLASAVLPSAAFADVPQIAGEAVVGAELVASSTVKGAWEWSSCTGPADGCTVVSTPNGQATTSSYVVQPTDLDRYLQVTLTVKDKKDEIVSSATVGPVTPAPEAPAYVDGAAITGTPTEGETLTAATGTWTGYPEPTVTVQWGRCTTADPATCSDVAGASDPAYAATADDVGAHLAATLTATNAAGTDSVTVVSDAPVAPAIVDDPPPEDPPAEDPPAEDPPAEDPPAEDPPAEDPPAEDPPADDPPAEDPPARVVAPEGPVTVRDEPAPIEPPALQSPRRKVGEPVALDVDDDHAVLAVRWVRCAGEDATSCEEIPAVTSPAYTPGARDAGMWLAATVTVAGPDGEVELTAAPFGPIAPQPTVAHQPLSSADPHTLLVEGTGFLPGSEVELTLYSDPIPLGSLDVRADGSFTATVRLPAGVTGEHTLEVVGLAMDAGPETVRTPVTLPAPEPATRSASPAPASRPATDATSPAPAPAPATTAAAPEALTELPRTGTSALLLATVGLLALLAGGALLRPAARRS